MFQILAKSYLSHELVLVTIHPSELSHMCKCVLQTISKLVSINISQPVLDMRVYNKLRKTQDFTTKMKSIAKSAFLAFLCSEGLHWFEVEVVIQMKIIQVLSVNKQIKHVVTLTTHLQSCFNPIKFGRLEKLGGFERSKEISKVTSDWF